MEQTTPKYPMRKQTLSHDDLIEWILQNIDEECESHIIETKHYTHIGIDREATGELEST